MAIPLALFFALKNRPQDICPGAGLFVLTLHRISLTILIRHSLIHLSLLRLSINKEVLGNLREQGVAEYVLILLLPLRALLLELGQLGLDEIGRTAGDRRLVTDGY